MPESFDTIKDEEDLKKLFKDPNTTAGMYNAVALGTYRSLQGTLQEAVGELSIDEEQLVFASNLHFFQDRINKQTDNL